MHYVIQENVFRERHYELLEHSLERYGLPYTKVRIFPFVDKIVDLAVIPDGPYNVDDLPEFVPPTDNVFCFGAIKLARIAAGKGWKPGSMMNANHDFMVYREHYRENLLNWDSKICKLTDDFGWKPGEQKFVRPTKDTKAFTGAVFDEDGWTESVKHNLHNFRTEQFNENTEVQVSTVKDIYKEIRFWVVDGSIVTGSTYRVGRDVVYTDVFEDEAREFAQSMVDKFQLADAFVIDVCLTDGGWKVVECGCINCAGFYKSDIQRMLQAVEEKFSY